MGVETGDTGDAPAGRRLRANRGLQVAEILAPFAVVMGTVVVFRPLVAESALAAQGVVWMGNVLMLTAIGLTLRVRGEGVDALGLTPRFQGVRSAIRTVGQSVLVFLAAAGCFVFGTIVMANVTGLPAGADTTELSFMAGNLPMLLFALAGSYLVSSFGEEFVYRGFLIRRVGALLGDGRLARWTAVAVSALVFGAAHYSWGITGVVQTTFMGLALGCSYQLLRRRLWPLVLAHGYMDTILMLQIYLS